MCSDVQGDLALIIRGLILICNRNTSEFVDRGEIYYQFRV
jgi:hypothetical protein